MRLAQTVVITVNRTLEWNLFTSQPKWNATRFMSRFSSILPTVVSHETHIENDAEIHTQVHAIFTPQSITYAPRLSSKLQLQLNLLLKFNQTSYEGHFTLTSKTT